MKTLFNIAAICIVLMAGSCAKETVSPVTKLADKEKPKLPPVESDPSRRDRSRLGTYD